MIWLVRLTSAVTAGWLICSRRVLTGANGAFTFSRLPAGRYVLCAQIAASEQAPANSPYVDTCVWGSGQTPIALAAGQQVAGVVFTAPKGAWLRVRVTDPDRVLPQVAAKGPAAHEPDLHQNGEQVADQDEVGFQPATAMDLNPMTFTLHRKQ